MGNIESSLTLRLIDRVTDPAKRMSPAFQQLERHVRRMERLGPKYAAASAILTRGAGMIAGAVGGIGGGMVARNAITTYADLDRRMTRIGITADESREAIMGATDALRSLAQETALPFDQVIGALETMVAQGMSLTDAMDKLPAVLRTAQAAGAETADIANSANALTQHLGITANKMQEAFDIVAKGGKLGQFELKDMARFLPSLAPAFAALGETGTKGITKLVAALQTVRLGTGTAEEAAASMQNIFAKMESDETTKKFKKFGIDLRKEMAKARKEGKDLFETFLDLSEKALKGDMSKLPQLFPDQEFARGMRALLTNRDKLREFIVQLEKAIGTVANDLTRITGDARSSIDRLSNSWTKMLASLGRAGDAAGITKVFEAIAEYAERAADGWDRIHDPEARRKHLEKFGIKEPGDGRKFVGRVVDSQRYDAVTRKIAVVEHDLASAEAARRTGNHLARDPESVRRQLEQLKAERDELFRSVYPADFEEREFERLRAVARSAWGRPAPGVPIPPPRPPAAGVDWSGARAAVPTDFASPSRFPSAFGDIADELAAAISGLDVTAKVEGSITYSGVNEVTITPSPLFDARVRSIIDEQLRGIVQRGGANANPPTGTSGSTGVSRPETAPGAGRDGAW
ncbi:phage tail tape measure protein [Blastochloris sulfoviridis]|nr:phage tail tape measure protein [Blastochloris sulfoviridis]